MWIRAAFRFYVRRTSTPAKKFATRIVLTRRVKTNESLLSTVTKLLPLF